MIRRFSLSARLYLGFFLLLLVTLGVGGLGMYRLHTLSELNRTIYDNPFTVRNALLEIRSDIQAMRSDVLAAIEAGGAGIEEVAEGIAALDRQVQKKFQMINERYLGPKDDFSELRAAYDEWHRSTSGVLKLLGQGKLEEARRLRREDVVPKREKLIAAMEVMVDVTARRVAFFVEQAQQERDRAMTIMATLLVFALFGSFGVALLIIRSITDPIEKLVTLSRDLALGRDLRELPVDYGDEIGALEHSFNAIISANNQIVRQAGTIAEGNYGEEVELRSEDDSLGIALQRMTRALAERERQSEAENWLKSGENQLGKSMRGNQDLAPLCAAVIGFLARWLDAKIGCLYLVAEDGAWLELRGSYAASDPPERFALGEGLVGQAAADGVPLFVDNLPSDFPRIRSAAGESLPRHLVILPFFFEERLLGVVELASFTAHTELEREFLSRISSVLGQGFNLALARQEMEELLHTTLRQSEELQAQQEELAAINEELEEQTQSLRASEMRLNEQQEELRATNEELEERTRDLELQREKVLEKNRDLEQAQRELEQRAHEVEVASRYKSDFLANMSHELRTPLNSILILARDLVENRGGNLLPPQIESAEVIHRSGIDLLNLINDILDLSKIEAGRMDLLEESFSTDDLADALKARFLPQARKKGIDLHLVVEDDAPETIRTDRQRLEQVLNNLIANGIKFTDAGAVTITFSSLSTPHDPQLAIAVRDTGIGIPADKLEHIFETFRQAESGTSRRYGGTGLGLTIARNLAYLLGGEISVTSEVGAGSTFTLRLPLLPQPRAIADFPPALQTPTVSSAPPIEPPAVEDDRTTVGDDGRTVLIVEDDPAFAATLRDVCRSMGFKALCALTGEAGLALARGYLPTAILLDLRLPGISGWQVLETLKSDIRLRHIPVHITSCEQPSREAFELGVVGFLTKPATREELEASLRNLENVLRRTLKRLLLVEDDDDLRCNIEQLISTDEIHVTSAESGASALEALKENTYDCMVLDLGLPDMSGFDLLKRVRSNEDWARLPVIVYTGRELSREEEGELRQMSEAIIIKGEKSEERLVDETTIFLHRVVKTLNRNQQHIINLHDRDFYLQGKVVLLVDDDMRNLFALAKILEQRGLTVVKAETGEKALSILRDGGKVDLILMDIMMPGIDGYEAVRAIRAMGLGTPVIALTAKAMKEDRDKCIAAGADDYLPKPVDTDRLISMMRVWLYA